jgi:DNA processing protein
MFEPAIRPIFRVDDVYPALLKKTPDAPLLLWQRGAGLNAQANYLAAVGSRQVNQEVQDLYRAFLEDFLTHFQDVVVISGLALGIDSVAHLTALEANVPTVAVLPTSITYVYPPENNSLADTIWSQAKHGNAVISEYSPLGPGQKSPFDAKARNRIIAGASKALLIGGVPQPKSGVLHTARLASEQGRQVFFVRNTVTSSVRAILLGRRAIEVNEPGPVIEALQRA